ILSIYYVIYIYTKILRLASFKYKMAIVCANSTVEFCKGLIIGTALCFRLALKSINKSSPKSETNKNHVKEGCPKKNLKMESFLSLSLLVNILDFISESHKMSPVGIYEKSLST